jgi:DNA-binding cell septation regulator SpoVG
MMLSKNCKKGDFQLIHHPIEVEIFAKSFRPVAPMLLRK